MKKTLLIPILFAAAFAGCNKTTTCSYPLSKIGIGIGFKGFTLAELDTIIVKGYTPNTGYTQLLRTDTVYLSNPQVTGDTVLNSNGAPFFVFNEGKDYTVSLPLAARVYKVTNVTYSGGDVYSFLNHDGDHCPTAGPFLHSPDGVMIDSIVCHATQSSGAVGITLIAK